MQESRLRWYGHIRRRPPDYVDNLALHLSLPGRRSRGRPKTRWKDVVLKDMSECQVSDEDCRGQGEVEETDWKSRPHHHVGFELGRERESIL
ncbi:hypothetical protein RR48_02520 [Papilio machaon]|uniref:Uncharacterized protein n=1 Tax=Papilio machaon TaxID=76193 RepID=A0A0N1PID4_PAPMA|nr:hypothetical protein RR48_02520 [Papilio machaon]